MDILELIKAKPILIVGPCAIESEESIFKLSSILASMGIKFLRGGAFKPRTSPDSFQGLGSEGLAYMRKAADFNKMFVVTEVLNSEQLDKHYDSIDIIQIGSRNMTSFGFLNYVGKKTSLDKKPVLLKRGMSSTINEFLNAAKYITQYGNKNIILCLRGIRTFEQIDSEFRNTPDLASILELKSKTSFPVIFDPSHSTGDSKYVVDISKAALNLGADGLIIECHDDPKRAMVDGKQSICPSDLAKLIKSIK
ncbi:MAG: 3-deoxy-7-phosphoheptulonate synthase [archaeon]